MTREQSSALRALLDAPHFPKAQCRGARPDAWFPTPSEHERILEARQVCGPCPHAEACYVWARDTGSVGIWGGIPLGPGMDLRAGGRLRAGGEALTFAEAEDVAYEADEVRVAEIAREREMAQENTA